MPTDGSGLSVGVNWQTNRITPTGVSYDNNGNVTQNTALSLSFGYDDANRLTTVNSTNAYAYDSSNRRVYYRTSAGAETVYLYGVDGKKLATYQMNGIANNTLQMTGLSQNVYFAGKLISAEGNAAAVDRLGSVRWSGNLGSGTSRTYYPYGVEYATTANDTEKYATYTRDSLTGLDYAMNRYYASIWGRFMSPDSYLNSAGPKDPRSWNRYAYVGGDPVNHTDRRGRELDAEDCISDPELCEIEDWGGGGYGGSIGGGDGGGCETSSGDNFDPSPTPPGPCPPPPPPPDCNAITAAVGFSGLTYARASEIWSDGSLSGYSTDSTAATIAALAAVTWQGESSFNLYPTNNGNYNSKGKLVSVDYGPFQINRKYNPNSNGAVWGTNGAGRTFNGDPDTNITFGIQILEGLYSRYGNGAAGRYVGSPATPNAQNRQAAWNKWAAALTSLFSDTDCFPHQ